MNIFILDDDIQQCARYHADKHVVKMITEYAQLMSSAVRLSGIDAGYRLTHQNHPCSIWVRESLSNWLWLKELATEVHKEWQYRYNHTKNHKAFDVILSLSKPHIDDNGLTPFVKCMPDECKTDSVVESYRNFYRGPKSYFVSWKGRETPEWIK